MAFSAKTPSVDDLRQPLKNLTINKAHARHHRVSKPRQPDRANAKTGALHSRVNRPKRRWLWLKPEQWDRAIVIFKKLGHIERVTKRVPRLCLQQSEDAACCRVPLEYPWYHFSKCLRGRSLPDLKGLDLPNLRKYIIQDLDLLYALHIPYAPDLTTLSVVEKMLTSPGMRPTFRPFISALDFDFNIDINDPNTPWVELMQTRKQMIEAQFDVVELLVAFSESAQVPSERLSIELDPDIVGKILENHGPPTKPGGQVIRQLNGYSTGLGRFMISRGWADLLCLPRRTEPMVTPDWKVNRIDDYLPIVDHVLCLIDQSIRDEGMRDINLLRDRACLLIIQTTMLIHLHAKVIPIDSSEGLFRKSGYDTVDSYTTYEGFKSVAHARHIAEEAVGELIDVGGKLDKFVMEFVWTHAERERNGLLETQTG
ncbi:hypothetical protein GQX73_g8873 [Xylaria multiplex]|uniref:Uncharacterized protein n=1 Tax=Xylaria multiplex TaxID=323545 RepID=A0A7C8IIT1_9PEZI|nr:hypothetical protein GQX73_g8873 [Xylaria multiplex]